MSTTTLQFELRQGGALTDPDGNSVLLSDATGTYGARRTDTLATVVADGTAMVRQSAGLYTYDVTDPAAGLTYQWVAEYAVNGITKRDTFTAYAYGSDYAGRYTSVGACKIYRGILNIKAWSSTDGTGNEDAAAEKEEIDVAEDFIDDFFNGSIYAIPFTPTGAALPRTIPRWATVIATFGMYAKRGLEDADPKANKLQRDYDRVLADMWAVKGGTMNLRGVAFRAGAKRAVDVVTPRYNRLSDGAGLVPTTQGRGWYG